MALGAEAIIGREKSNNIYINDERASRQHAKITKEPDGLFLLVDMGSRNGMIVNGEKVSRRKLIDKDRIVIGRTTLVYSEAVSASDQAPSPLPTTVETPKVASDDKTITAELAKLGSDALKKAIQDVTSDHSADKTAATKKTAFVNTDISKAAQAPKSAVSGGEVTDEEPSLGKRIIVFLAFLIFFVAILLFAKEMTKRLLSKAEKPQPAPNISSPEKTTDK